MELRALKYLVSLAEHGSFTAAAREHFVTQPAVSIQLRKLQEEFGARLYQVAGRRLRFTAAGERVLEYARRMIDIEQQLKREMEDVAGLRRGGVSIGTIDAASIYVLPPVFSAFRARYPGIDLRAEVSSTLPLLEGLAAGRFDLVVGTLAGGKTDGRQEYVCDTVEVFRERLVPIAPPRHPLLERRRRIRALCDYPFISFHRESVTRRLIEESLRALGVELKITMEIDSPEAIRNLVASGLGLSILPQPTVREAIGSGILAEPRMPGLRIERRIGLMVPRGRYLPAPVRAFLAVMREVLGIEPPRGSAADTPTRRPRRGGSGAASRKRKDGT